MKCPGRFRANGKLLLSGEYCVLDGALALALPTRLGQTLSCLPGDQPGIEWISLDADGQVWFEGYFRFPDWTFLRGSDTVTGQNLQAIGQMIHQLRPEEQEGHNAFKIVTQLEFPRQWGLGSSSTLIFLLAALTGTNPYTLLAASFGGSGYDLACAGAEGPILFQRNAGTPNFVEIPFRPAFSNQLFFVYLGKKQNSREGISRYRELMSNSGGLTQEISRLSWEMAAARDFGQFCSLVQAHEKCISEALQLPRAGELYFPDFPGVIKSLGAWGGDFVLAASPLCAKDTRSYFSEKGFQVCLSYDELILNRD